MPQFLLLLFVLLGVICTSNASNETYYIKSTDNSSCPEDSSVCLTLSESVSFLHNSSAENITIILLAGNHTLNTDLIVENVTSFTMFTTDDSDIVCEHENTSFQFYSISQVEISGLVFHGCRVSCVNISNQFTLNRCEIRGGNTLPTTAAGVELNSVKNADVFESIFAEINNTLEFNATKGGAIQVNSGHITIVDSIFDHNSAGRGSSVYALKSSITIANSNFTNNEACHCGGAIVTQQCNVIISKSRFVQNTIQPDICRILDSDMYDVHCPYGVGGACSFIDCNMVEITDSEFINNEATRHQTLIYIYGIGGAICSVYSAVITNNSMFSNNNGHTGGAIGGLISIIEVHNSDFILNVAVDGGGGIGVLHSTLQVNNSDFINNTLEANSYTLGGGAVGALGTYDVIIDGGLFSGNSAPKELGGAIAVGSSESLIVKNAMFIGNEARIGGAILVTDMEAGTDPVLIENCSFTNNIADTGAAIAAYSSTMTTRGSLDVQDNTANVSVLYVSSSTAFFKGTLTINNNNGSLFAYNSQITLDGNNFFENNMRSRDILDQGGGLTSFQSTVNFTGEINIMNNEANKGGGILLTESMLYNFGNTNIEHNRAYQSGGGIYAFQSVVHTRKNMSISFNKAESDGGGVFLDSSSIEYHNQHGNFDFFSNNATGNGGAMYLKSNSKLYIRKESPVCYNKTLSHYVDCFDIDRLTKIDNFCLHFHDNMARYGGALFVADNTTADTCSATQSSQNIAECFFQVLASYNLDLSDPIPGQNFKNIYFANNSAQESGDTIFGGLLDRCTVSSFAEVLVEAQKRQKNNFINGFTYFNEISNLNLTEHEVSSEPIHVCFCNGTTPDCAYKPPTRYVFKGETFEISLVAVDQVNNTIPNTTIHGSVLAATESLGEGQTIQRTNDGCTSLQYNVFSPNDNTKLYLYANGPCKDRGNSLTSVAIKLNRCPIGFKNENNRCECDFDLISSQYIMNCSINSQSVVRVNNTVWISFVNDTELRGYVTYPNCPFDYCKTATEQEVTINLNEEDGSDAQCAFNRSGTLCGRCANGTSVILGSSRCMDCNGQNAYLSLFIVFALAGVLLVTFLLALNLTVAVGTINGLIFYANIIAANRAIFIRPFSSSNILHVFIAWVNLDFGFETCLFDGMDDYIKTWLQLAFPLYIIFLVVLIIIITEKSQRMTKLLQNRNPVATLATLVLLSYAKGLRVVLTAFSYARLEYPTTISSLRVIHTVWLIDGNVEYFEREHILLLVFAFIVLLAGVLYTLLIFSWQWLLRCPSNKKCFKWISNTRLKSFMDAYNAPYKPQHRYWTGLLLLARILLYLIASVDIVYSPPSIYLSIIIIVSIILLFGISTGGGPYKNWLLNMLEISFTFNLLIFAAVSHYIHGRNEQEHHKEGTQNALSNASISIAFITFIIILIYHIYILLSTKFSKIKQFAKKIGFKMKTQTRLVGFTKAQETVIKPKKLNRLQQRMDLLGDEPIELGLVPQPLVQQRAKVTHTVIDGIPAGETKL